MSPDTLTALQALDSATIAGLVRQDQRSAAFEVRDWTVQPLSHEKIIDTTGGLYRFSGEGWDGQALRAWSIVLKVINRPAEGCQDPRDWCYWGREAQAFQSGLLADLPSAIGAPRCYGVAERGAESWVWLEHIVEATSRRWSLEHYRRAAYQLGRFGGAYLGGAPLPAHPWLSAPFFRSVFADGDWWATYMDPDSPGSAWRSPLVQRAFAEPLRGRVLELWAQKRQFFEANDRLPQVLCHNDFHRRNLMLRLRADGREQLIALDWAFCGPGGIANDLGCLVGSSTYFYEIDPAQAGQLEATVFEGYLAGLADAGWRGDPRLARLGYTLSIAMWMGTTLPGWSAWMLSEENGINPVAMYGRDAETVLAGWVTLAEFALARADEARQLMRELGLA